MTPNNQPRTRFLLLCLSIMAGLSTMPDKAVVAATPFPASYGHSRDAFLPIPASNLESILEQVQSMPAVRRHYARYFHMPQSRVAPYLRANLVPGRLHRGGLYTVYYVRANGLIYPTLLTLPSGSPVFALKGGTPVLTWNEGNPLVKAKKAVPLSAVKPAPPSIPVAPAAPPPPMQVIVPNQVDTTVVPPSEPQQATGQ